MTRCQRSHRLLDVRWTALFLCVAVSTALQTRGLHTHAYGDHAHGDHHHGPAAHDHHEIENASDASAQHISSCDPGRHLRACTFICHAPAPAHTVDADCTVPLIPPALHESRNVVHTADIRVHGPPSLANPSLRGPPLQLSA